MAKRERCKPQCYFLPIYTMFPERHEQLDQNHTHRSQDQEDRDIKKWIEIEGRAFAIWTMFIEVVGKMALR